MISLAEQLKGKRVGLALSSGYFGFYHHAGVLKAVLERGITPVKITGTSAGAIVAAMYASGLSPDEISKTLLSIKRADFWDMHWPLSRLGFGLLSGNKLRTLLERVLQVSSFEDCQCSLTVGAYELNTGRVHHLSQGALSLAVYASCAYPYLFTPITINGNRYWDGGFGEKTPLVPFLNEPKTDAVIISYIPLRNLKPESGISPSLSSLFAKVPPEERIERDQESVRLLRAANKQVFVLAPPSILLGPFALNQAPQAFKQGYTETVTLLDSTVPVSGHKLLF